MSAPVTALLARLRPAPSIRNKLVGLSFAFLLAIVMLIFMLVQTQQKELLQTQWAEAMAAQARLLASNSQAAVAFNDKYEAKRLLSSLAINPAILASRTVLPNGKALGEFRNREDFLRPFPPGEAGSRFLDDILIVREPILTPGQAIPTGHIELMVSLEQYHRTMRRTLLQTAGVLALALAVLLIASRYFVGQLTAPLEKLDELANHISRDATLDQRLGIERNDEIGSLAKSFDRMLDSLQHRDRELARYRDSLESMVAARTRELQAAMEESRQASRAKSDFLARMSHEIRTPMNAIIGLNHMVLDSELAPQQREYLEQVLHSAENLLVIINDILDYSKIEAGRLTLEHKNFEPAKVFQSLQAMFATRAQAKGIDFTIDVDPAVPPVVVGDSLRLGQVLINLVGNALKFTESGTVAVHATLHAPAADHRVRIDFVASDTGIGIDAEHLAHLFTPFTQADSSITRRFGGTGLGLAICQQLIELMGGHIDVESAPGRGSTFRFSVELGIPEPGSDAVGDATRLPDGQAAAAPPRWNGERILLVEDVPLNRTVAVALLKKAGLDVAVAADGQEALDRLAGEDFRLVLMDIQMPVMDGLTATRALRAEPRFHDLPVIAMTAHASGEDKRLSEEAGMNAHLTKPIIPRLLYETIGRWLPPVGR